MARASIRQDADGYVVLVATDPVMGERISAVYFAPRSGGYVREYAPEGGHPQVCEMLRSTGAALAVRSPADLLGVIRREWRRLMRAVRED